MRSYDYRRLAMCAVICAGLSSAAVASPRQEPQPQQQQQPPQQEKPRQEKQHQEKPRQETKAEAAQPETITMDQLEDNPRSYIGKQFTVEAEVERVLGPRLLAVDNRQWFDFDGDTLVFIRAPLAGLVSEGAHVTITGTMQPFVKADIEREWGWFGDDPTIVVELEKRPVLVAHSIRSDQGLELTMRMAPESEKGAAGEQTARQPEASQPRDKTPQQQEKGTTGEYGATGTTGTGAGLPLGPSVTDLSKLATATDREMVGRHVKLSNARVTRMADKGGFWVQPAQGDNPLLVVPASPSNVTVQTGQTVGIDGVVLQMPRAMRQRAEKAQHGKNEQIYVLASVVRQSQ